MTTVAPLARLLAPSPAVLPLVTLSLANNRLSMECIHVLMGALRSNETLLELDLANTCSDAAVYKAVGACLEANGVLKSLSLAGNGLGERNFESLVAGLLNNHTLHALNLSGNVLAYRAGVLLASAGGGNLLSLDLRYNHIGAAHVDDIASALASRGGGQGPVVLDEREASASHAHRSPVRPLASADSFLSTHSDSFSPSVLLHALGGGAAAASASALSRPAASRASSRRSPTAAGDAVHFRRFPALVRKNLTVIKRADEHLPRAYKSPIQRLVTAGLEELAEAEARVQLAEYAMRKQNEETIGVLEDARLYHEVRSLENTERIEAEFARRNGLIHDLKSALQRLETIHEDFKAASVQEIVSLESKLAAAEARAERAEAELRRK